MVGGTSHFVRHLGQLLTPMGVEELRKRRQVAELNAVQRTWSDEECLIN